VHRRLLIAVPIIIAVTVAAFAATRSNDSTAAIESPAGVSSEPIAVPLSVYVVHEADAAEGLGLSSNRTEAELLDIATKADAIWAQAGITFSPIVVHTVDLPGDVVADLMAGDSRSFMDGSAPAFAVPDPGAVNGFYIPFAGGANGFTPRGSRVFFVADVSSVHDERVTSHEIGHIFGLSHNEDDPGRLMFGGTNGMVLSPAEIAVARATAAGLPGATTATPTEEVAQPTDGNRTLANEGGSAEGHTPRGFAGMGTGLFAGDDLNPNFPSGDGVQLFLSFALPAGLGSPSSAILSTDAMQVSGTPFGDLGTLRAESISYETFGPQLFDLAADGEPMACERVGDHGLTCDVTAAVASDIADGVGRTQFRLKFDIPGDGDGSQDLAMFFRTDPNIDDPGIFTIELSR